MIIALAEIIKITINSFKMCTEYQTNQLYVIIRTFYHLKL